MKKIVLYILFPFLPLMQVKASDFVGAEISYKHITGNTYELMGLEECNEYEFQIRSECDNSMSGWSNSYNVRTFGCGACFDFTYCETTSNNSNDDQDCFANHLPAVRLIINRPPLSIQFSIF